MVIELITSITLLQTSFSLHRANPSEAADTSFQTSEPNRAYKHRVIDIYSFILDGKNRNKCGSEIIVIIRIDGSHIIL